MRAACVCCVAILFFVIVCAMRCLCTNYMCRVRRVCSFAIHCVRLVATKWNGIMCYYIIMPRCINDVVFISIYYPFAVAMRRASVVKRMTCSISRSRTLSPFMLSHFCTRHLPRRRAIPFLYQVRLIVAAYGLDARTKPVFRANSPSYLNRFNFKRERYGN